MQFGAIGMVIGHELIHAFDASGRQFDEAGNLNDWWNDEAEAAYRNRTHCLVDQYANFTLGKQHVNNKINFKSIFVFVLCLFSKLNWVFNEAIWIRG